MFVCLLAHAGFTPLMRAAKAGDIDSMKSLLEKRSSINYQSVHPNHLGCTALYFAAKYGRYPAVVELISQGADPRLAHRPSLMNPIMIAAVKGHVEVVRALLFLPGIIK